MIDPLISLSFSMQSNPGVFSLLLGSGLSRAAGIPTGWEVVLDLVRKIAELEGEDPGPRPDDWYRAKLGEEPDYSSLLNRLARTPAERTQLLKVYFEPAEAERERGLKTPTAAHRAIAELCTGGYVRVMLTTNFDRLIETSLIDAGITPVVISTGDAAEGAPPITHSRCTVIKLHGDYLDTRLKNTPEELASYDARMDELLDRVLDEFGLIVCGWSAEWDPALRAAIERCKSRRFSTYWVSRGKPSKTAQTLIELRTAESILAPDADPFFQDLAEKIDALERISKPHPLSASMASATLKRYLPDARRTIEVHDLVSREIERAYAEMSEEQFPAQQEWSAEDLQSRVGNYEVIVEIPLALAINLARWGSNEHVRLLTKSIERIANPPGERSGKVVWIELRIYPATMLMYGAGIAALAAERYEILPRIFTDVRVRDTGEEKLAVLALPATKAFHNDAAKQLPGLDRRKTPASDHLFEVLRDPLRELLPSDYDYQMAFDRFEYYWSLVYADVSRRGWAPPGCFSWRGGSPGDQPLIKQVTDEISDMGEGWPPLKVGLFGGSLERLQQAKEIVDSIADRVAF